MVKLGRFLILARPVVASDHGVPQGHGRVGRGVEDGEGSIAPGEGGIAIEKQGATGVVGEGSEDHEA